MERIIEEIECLVCDLKAKEEEYKKKIDELEKKLVSATEDYKILREYCEKILQHKVKSIRKEWKEVDKMENGGIENE